MPPLEVDPDRLFTKLGRQGIELDVLHERVAELEAELARRAAGATPYGDALEADHRSVG